MIRGRSRVVDGSGLSSVVSRARGVVKSIQRGTILVSAATSATATIVAVNPNNTILNFLGASSTTITANTERAAARIDLTDSVTVTATKVSGTDAITVSFEVVEYCPGIIKTPQRGTITLASVASNTGAIVGVNLSKTNLVSLGLTMDAIAAATTQPDCMQAKTVLTNSTTITASRNNTVGTLVIGYQIVEYY